MTDYTIFYKKTLPLDKDWSREEDWDIFISAYNSSDRVRNVFARAQATTKHWLILPDYDYSHEEHPPGEAFAMRARQESEFILAYAEKYELKLPGQRVCVDITGFIKPYMMFLLKWLMQNGVNKFDVLYSEPDYYAQKEETKFSDEEVLNVRQVTGFEGIHIPNTSNDILIIGAGYDNELIAQVAESKDNSRKIQLFGLPSLRPEMYQENP